MGIKSCIILSLAVFSISVTNVCSQKTYQLANDGTLLLDPPPNLTDSNFLEVSNPSYLSFIYSSANGISNSISTGVTPVLDATLAAGNSSCIIESAFSDTPDVDSSVLVTWLLGIILLSVLGIFMSVCMAMTCCLVCLSRVVCGCCGTERTQNISPSCTLVNLCVYSPMLLTVLAIAVFGCIFGLLSANSLNTNLSNAPEIFDNTFDFINEALSDISTQLQFTLLTQFSATLEATAQQVQGHFDNAFDDRLIGLVDLELGVDELQMVATKLEEELMSISLLIASFDSLTSEITSQLEELQNLCSTFGISCGSIPDSVTELSTGSVSSIISQLNALSTTNSNNLLQNFTTPIVSEVNTLTSIFDSLDISVLSNAVDDVIGSDILSTFDSSVSVIFETYEVVTRVVFALAIIIFLFIFVQSFLTLLGLVLALLGYDRRAKSSERTALSDKGAKILAVSGYLSMFSTWLLIPILVAMFSLGSVVTTTCQPFLDRSILDYISPCLSQDVEIGNFGFTSPRFNLTEIFESCENGESILRAVRADELIDNIIMNVSDRIDIGIDRIRGLVTPTVVSEGIIEGLTAAYGLYNPDNFNFTAVNTVINALDNATVTQRINIVRLPILNLVAQVDNFFIRNLAEILLDELDEIVLDFVAEADVITASIISDLNLLSTEMNIVNETITTAIETAFQIASNATAPSVEFIGASFDSLDRNVGSYLSYVRDNIPTCTFLTDFYTGVVGIVCTGIFGNFNAVWFCFGWALISMFSSSIFSFIVSRYAVRRGREYRVSPKSKATPDLTHPAQAPKQIIYSNGPGISSYLDVNNHQPPPPYIYRNEDLDLKQTVP